MNTPVSFPSTGRIPLWTGWTLSGIIPISVVNIPNRQVQLHFHSDENVEPFDTFIDDFELQTLATFLYEYTMRHFGFTPDDLTSANFLLPQLNDNGTTRLRHDSSNPTQHLRIAHPDTVGRDLFFGCPAIGNHLANFSLQAAEILYSHYKHRNLDELVIKVTFQNSSPEFNRDLAQGFPDFQHHVPMMSRNRHTLSPRNHIFRSRMRVYNSAFTFAKHNYLQNIHRKCPGFDHYRFELQLNSEFCQNFPVEFLTFNQKQLDKLSLLVLDFILDNHSSNYMNLKLSSDDSKRLYQHLININNPIIKILNSKLSSQAGVPSALACTKTVSTTTALFIVKLCISC